MTKNLNLAIIGTGYVGLVSALCFCKMGHNVTAIDNDQTKLAKLKQGISTLFEKDIDLLLTQAISDNLINFTDDLSQLSNKDAIFIAVGTPFNYDNSETDLSQLNNALKEIANYASKSCLIINKSTAPVGTYKHIKTYFKKLAKNFNVAINPEFLAQGQAIDNFLHPDRVVVGFDSEPAQIVLRKIYQPLINQNINYIETDPISSEIAKYAANNFLAMKIAFINEIANLSESVSANYDDIKKILVSDNRIDSKFLNAGPGFGGSCFPKDAASFAKSLSEFEVPDNLISAINLSNDSTIEFIIKRIKKLTSDSDKIINILGLTFKAGTDDVRSSQAIKIINDLLANDFTINAYDPKVNRNHLQTLINGSINITSNHRDCFNNSNLCIILTEWPEFKNYDYNSLCNQMQQKQIFDTRNILDAKKLSDSEIILYKRGH